MRIDHLLHAADKMKLDTATIRENLRKSPHHEDTEFNNDLAGVENQLIQSFTFGQLSLNAADKWLTDALDDYGRRNAKAEVNPCACGKETVEDFEKLIGKK
jgi:hypothetical protein